MSEDTATYDAGKAATTIRALSAEFPPHVIQMKPGSKPGSDKRRPATPYVSHGSCTKRLNDICPGWSTRLVEMHSYLNANGVLVCAGVTLEMTVPGAGSHVEFGVANQPRGFGDDAKNAMSDALKRCAMRFGVALDLWESADEYDEDYADINEGMLGGAPKNSDPGPQRFPAAPRQQPAPRPAPAAAAPASTDPTQLPATEKQTKFARAIAREAGIDEHELETWTQELYGRSVDDLNRRDMSALIEALQRRRNEVA